MLFGESQHFSYAGRDDRRNIGVPNNFLQVRGKVFGNYNRLRSRIRKLMPHFSGSIKRIGIDNDQPRPKCTKKRDRVLQKIGHHEGDFIPRFQTPGMQIGAKCFGVFVNICERQFFAHAGKRYPATKLLKGIFKHIHQCGIFIRIDIGRNTAGVILQPGPLVTHNLLYSGFFRFGYACCYGSAVPKINNLYALFR